VVFGIGHGTSGMMHCFCIIDTTTLVAEVAVSFVLVAKQKKAFITARCSGSVGGWGIKMNWGWCWQLLAAAEANF